MTSYIPTLSCRVEIINEHEQLHPSASVDTVGDTVHPSNMDVSVLVCVCISPVHSPVQPVSLTDSECMDTRVNTGCHYTIF